MQRAGRAQAAVGFNVWRSWDEPGGIRDELYSLARKNPQLVKLEVLGHDTPGSRADRAEGHAGRARGAGRLAPGGALLVEPARPRVDQPRGQPAPAAPLHRQLARERQGDQGSAQEHRAVVRHRPRTRTATSTRSTTSACGARTCATTTATGRSPSATASIPTATSTSTGATTTRARRRTRRTRPTAVPARPRSPRRRLMQGLIDRIKPKFQSNLHSFGAVAPVSAGLADRDARRGQPDLRRRSAAPTPTRRSRASTRASRPTRCTSPTARRPTTRTPTPARSPTRPSSARVHRARASCSPTTRR